MLLLNYVNGEFTLEELDGYLKRELRNIRRGINDYIHDHG